MHTSMEGETAVGIFQVKMKRAWIKAILVGIENTDIKYSG